MFIKKFNLFRFTVGFQKLDFRIRDFKNLKDTKPVLLDQNDVARVLKAQQLVSTWKVESQTMSREIKFKNFKEAFSFMNQVAIMADQIDHHPDWENVYSTVKIQLSTHDIGGLSIKDLFLAHSIDQIAMNVLVKSAENTLDTRIFEISTIAQNWNHNFDQYQKMVTNKQVD